MFLNFGIENILQEGFEREKEDIKRKQEITLQYNQEAHHRFSKELELAITNWKCAMNRSNYNVVSTTRLHSS
jgi:hypothetical protein